MTEMPEPVNINTTHPGVTKLIASAGWDFNPYNGDPLDVDLSAFVLGRDNVTRDDGDFIFYNNPNGASLNVKHLGDNRSGMGEGDDEAIMVDLDGLSFDAWRIVFVVSLYQGEDNDRSFKDLREATFRLEDAVNGTEIARMNFNAIDVGDATAIRVAEVYRDGVEWHFTPLNEPVTGGLGEIATSYGLLISSTS